MGNFSFLIMKEQILFNVNQKNQAPISHIVEHLFVSGMGIRCFILVFPFAVEGRFHPAVEGDIRN